MAARRVWAASAVMAATAALMAAPALADDFWSSFTKDVRGLTGAIKDGVHDVIDTKKEVEKTIEDAPQSGAEPSGPGDDEPRYDRAWVAELQRRLTAGGYDPGPVDGAFGNRTAKAVAAFQRDTGIPADGLPRSSLMRALRAQTQGIQTAQPAPAGETVLGAAPPAAPTAEAAYPNFVQLALRADAAAFAAQREVAGVAYRLAVADGPACQQLAKRFAGMSGDVFLARDFALESADLLDQALAGIDATPPALEVSLSDQVFVQPYDFAAGGFPLPPIALVRGGKRDLTDRISAPPCDAGLSLHHALPKQAMSVSGIGLGRLSVELEGAPGAQVLPMAESDARAFEARNARRAIELVGHVRLEPPDEAFGPLRGRILALEARDPDTGATLYRFPVVPAVAEAVDPQAPGYQPEYADFVNLALMSDLEAYLADAETTGLAYLFATADAKECQRLSGLQRSQDEFARRELAANAAQRLREVAGTLQNRPRHFEITIEANYRLADYDFERGGFPFDSLQKREHPILAPGVVVLPGAERPPFCATGPEWQRFGADLNQVPTFMGLGAEHQGVPSIDLLPMPVEQARAFRAAGKGTAVLRAELVVEPRAQGRGPLAGQIVAISAYDPENGELLHRFDLGYAGPSMKPSDGPQAWTAHLAAALLGPAIEPTLSDEAFDQAATSYFTWHKRTIDQGNLPPEAPLPIEEMRGHQAEVIVALNRDRLRAGLRESAVATPISVVIEEELFPYYDEAKGLTLSAFVGHQWLGSAKSDPLRSTTLSRRDLPLYERPKFLWPWNAGDELGYRADVITRAHVAPALELDRIVRLDPLAVDIERAAARGLVGSYDPRRDRVIVRWELEVLGARMDGETPVISARLTALSFRWSSDNAPLASVDIASLPTVAALRAPEIAAQAQVQAEQAERERRKAEAAAAQLDAILRGRTGMLLIRRADADRIGQVLVESERVAQEYRKLVLVNALDLPAKARVQSGFGPMTAQFLRDGSTGTAVFVDSEVFARELFDLVADLDLEAESLLSDREEAHETQTASRPNPATPISLQTLAPGDAPLLLVRRREDVPIVRVFEQNGVNYGSRMQEAKFLAQMHRDFDLVLDLPERAQTIDLDEAPDLLRMAPGAAVVLQREGLATILPKISDLDLVAVRFPIEEYQFGDPKAHTKGPDAFAVLGITGRMDEAETLEQLNWTFAPEEIVREPDSDQIRVSRGSCDPARAIAPGETAEIGAYCLALGLADGAVAHLMLRQVIEGDTHEAVLAALAERYGRSQRFREDRYLERGGRRIVFGWGGALDAGRDQLGRVAAKSPPAVLEAVVWVVDGVTTLLLQLDDVPTVAEVQAAQAPEIKF